MWDFYFLHYFINKQKQCVFLLVFTINIYIGVGILTYFPFATDNE